jgi:hypothetical protein
MRGGMILRRQPRSRFEHAVEITGTAADGVGEIIQGQLFLALLDQATGLRDEGCIFAIDRWPVGIAAFARPEARRFGRRERIVQLHVLRVGGSRGARRPAKNPGRYDRVP